MGQAEAQQLDDVRRRSDGGQALKIVRHALRERATNHVQLLDDCGRRPGGTKLGVACGKNGADRAEPVDQSRGKVASLISVGDDCRQERSVPKRRSRR